MEFIYPKKINVEKLAQEIKAELGFNFIAENKDDSVNGYIEYVTYEDKPEGVDFVCVLCETIFQKEHYCSKIVFYDKDEQPDENHKTILVKTVLTDEQKIQLDNIVANHTPEEEVK